MEADQEIFLVTQKEIGVNDPEEKDLPINIEGEPREQGEEEKSRGAGERPPLREEAIRQILEEFLA